MKPTDRESVYNHQRKETTMTTMRAKMYVQSITRHENSETLKLCAVSAKSYPNDGTDENNTFAKWTPNATLEMTITNKELIGKFEPKQEFYVDFTKVE